MKKLTIICLCLALLLALAPTAAAQDAVYRLQLSGHTATLDGAAVPEYDYTWHADPTADHDQVKNSPAEYYTGTAPTGTDPVYIAHDIIYYPEADQSKFQQVRYDGETEWVRMYEAEGYENYIFSTLPALRTGFPGHMMHTPQEAYQNPVLHITQPGTYSLSGTWNGQIWVDLGEDAFDDPRSKVTLILNGVDITCTVAPGLVFYSVYECDNAWEDRDSHSQNVDTQDAGANIVIADGTVNHVSGTNVFRILKTKFKDEASQDAHPAQKKAWKQDGAFYSYMSMNITGGSQGSGVLNIESGNEGLNSELHLTLNGGNVNIFAQDDGINVNEDDVSTLTVNGGSLHICAGLGAEGDGIDSNGYLVINGGTVISAANPAADSGLDSDCGSFVNGGTVVALGATMDWAESDDSANSSQPVLNMQFSASQSSDEAIILTDTEGKVVFAYDPDKDEVTSENARSYQGAIISAPGLEIGGSYRVYIGGDVQGSEISGVYDAATVTGFTGAIQQGYSGNSLDSFGGGRPGGFDGQRPDGDRGDFQRPDKGERPNWENRPDNGDFQRPEGEGFQGGQMPASSIPNGFQGGQVPEGMEDMTPPDGFGGGNMGGFDPGGMGGDFGGFGQFGGQTIADCTANPDFTLSKQVNAFRAICDYTHTLSPNDSGSYTCSVCGQNFADDQAQQRISDGKHKEGLHWAWWLAIVLGALALAAGVVLLIVWRVKKSKASQQPAEIPAEPTEIVELSSAPMEEPIETTKESPNE